MQQSHFENIIEIAKHHFIESIVLFRTLGYFLGVLAFDKLGIPQDQLTAFACLMFADVFTGFLKVRKVNAIAFTSEKLTDGIIKKFLLVIVIFAMATLAKFGVNIEIEHFLEWGIGALMVAETYSIIQNVYIHRTGKVVKEYDAITYVLKALGDALLKLMKWCIKKISLLITQ